MISQRAIDQARELDARARTGQKVRIRCRLVSTGWQLLDEGVERAIAYAVELALAGAPGWRLVGISFPVVSGRRVCDIIVERTS